MDTSKLPKWAQDHIRTLERQRDAAVQALNEHLDSQTEAPFYFEDHVSTGESNKFFKRFYVQTHKITVEWAGVELNILLRPSDNVIDLRWNGIKGSRLQHVAFVPKSFQSAELISKENMR